MVGVFVWIFGEELVPLLLEFLLAVLTLVAIPLMYVIIRWLLNQGIGVVATIPIAGGRLQQLGFGLRDLVGTLFRAYEGDVVLGGRVALYHLGLLMQGLLVNPFNQIAAHLLQLDRVVQDHSTDFLVYTWPTIHQLQDQVAQLDRVVQDLSADFTVYTWPTIHQLQDLTSALIGEMDATVKPQLSQLQGRAGALEAQAAAAGGQLAELRGFLPLLIPLQDFEQAVRRDLEALGGAVTAQDARLGSLERYRALLALLSVLGLLSLSQVQELARTARCVNVCEQLGILSDLDDRVESLENAGH